MSLKLKFNFEIFSNASYQKNNLISFVKKCLFLGSFFVVPFFYSGQIAQATLDDLENKLREQEPIQIRWDNVDGPPFWICGPQPIYDRKFGFHVINLNAQEPVTIRLTQEAHLRINDPTQILTPSDLEVFVSNGSGLYVEQSFVQSGKDLILNPLNFGATIVKVKLKSKKRGCIPLGFFISRIEPPAQMAPYRTHLDTSGEFTKLLSHTTGVPEASLLESFYQLCPPQMATLEIEGPVRLNLLTRYVYDHLDTGHTFMYRVNVLMDDKKYHTAEYIGQPDQNHVFYSTLDPYILTLPDISLLEIPKGKHTLTLYSNSKIFYRIQKLEDTGYSLPSLNAPCLKNRPLPPNKSALELPTEGIKSLKYPNLRDSLAPSFLQQLALKLGKDNFWQSDGLQSVFLLDERFKKRSDGIDLEVARNQSEGLFTFYRDLLPTEGAEQKTQKFVWAIDWDLRDPKDEGKETFVLESHKNDLLKHLLRGYFFSSGSSLEESLVYTLPQRRSPSFLRVLVNQSALKKPQALWVQYNDAAPFKLIVFPQEGLSSEAYKPTRGLMGLALLNDPQSTLGGSFNFRANPGPLLCASSLEIPLLADTKQVRIWNVDKNAPSLEVALQYKASRPYRLEHRIMLEELRRIKNPEGLFIAALDFVIKSQEKKLSCGGATFWAQLKGFSEESKQPVLELYNHWLELLRLLAGRHQRFIASFGDADPIFVKPGTKTLDAVESIKIAEKFFEESQYQEALQTWSEILYSSDKVIWRKAHMGRIQALRSLGEKYLTERYLRTLFLKTEDKELKEQAFNELLTLLKNEKDYFNLEGVLTERLLSTKDPRILELLSDVLLEDNHQEIAIDLAHVVSPKRGRSNENLIFAALRENKARTGERLGESTETQTESCFWNAQLAQSEGRYEMALELFDKAGSKGNQWRDHLAKGLTIQNQLHAPDLKTRKAAIEDWMVWTRDHPGPYAWESANSFVKQFFQATTIYNPVIDRFDSAYLAHPKNPLQLKLIGPARMQFRVKVLFDKNTPIPYKGWIEIKDNGTPLNLPIPYTFPSEELEIIGHEGRPGLIELYEISVGAGEHTIELTPQEVDIIVDPFIQRPILPLTVLPPVTHDSLSLVLEGSRKCTKVDDALDFTVLSNNAKKGDLRTASANPSLYQILPVSNPTLFSQVMDELSRSKKIKPYTLPEEELAAHHLSLLLQVYEENPSEELLIEAKNFWTENLHYLSLAPLWSRFTQLSSWTPIEVPQNSAGLRSLPPAEAWKPQELDLVLRKDLIDEDIKDYVLTGTSPLVFQFFNEEATPLKITSSLAKLLADDLRDISWGYQLDDGKINSIHFTPSDRSDTREINIPEGEHSLRFFLENPTANTFVKIKLYEKTITQPNWQPLVIEPKKDYLVATKTDPIILDIEGPAWLRIDEWVNGKVISKDCFVKEGSQKIEIRPKKEGEEKLLRVYRRISRAPNIAKPGVPASAHYVPVKVVPTSFIRWDQPPPIKGKEVLPLGGQENGTLSLTASLNRRLAFDVITPNKNTDTLDYYGEERATYRYFDEINRFFWRGTALSRQRRRGDPTFGIEGLIEYSPLTWPITLWAEGKGYTQYINNTLLSSGTIEGGARHKLIFNEKVNQIVDVSLLGRKLHFNQNAVLTTVPDSDVYTKYLATHPRALNFSYKINYFPFMDTQLWAQVSGTTLPSLNPIKLDFFSSRVGINQLAGPIIFSLDYGIKHYYKTRNPIRPLSFNRHTINFAISYNEWLRNHERLEWRFDVGRIFDANLPKNQSGVKAWVGLLSFTWHFGNGRDFRDFSPREILFRDIRERSLPPVQIGQEKASRP